MADRVRHNIEPVYDESSEVLILGSMPSPWSRVSGFYYGHPGNRFWRVIEDVFSSGPLVTNRDKKKFLLKNHIAMWDVLRSCAIDGASDSSIRDPEVNDICLILAAADIKAVFTTGMKATELYRKYCFYKTGIESLYLPSTSAANSGRYNFDDLKRSYGRISEYLGGRR